MKFLLTFLALLMVVNSQVLDNGEFKVDFNGQSSGFRIYEDGSKFVNLKYNWLSETPNIKEKLMLINSIVNTSIVESREMLNNNANVYITSQFIDKYLKIAVWVQNWPFVSSSNNLTLTFTLSDNIGYNYTNLHNNTILTDDYTFKFENTVIADGIEKAILLQQSGNQYQIIFPYFSNTLYYDPVVYANYYLPVSSSSSSSSSSAGSSSSSGSSSSDSSSSSSSSSAASSSSSGSSSSSSSSLAASG